LLTLRVLEYLNYENGKFSKSRNVGVFGNNVVDSKIPISVWRYYLIQNRPENGDTMFTWRELIARNNAELLNNLGNFINRIIKFTAQVDKYDSKVPEYDIQNINAHELESALVKDVNALLAAYHQSFEQVKLRQGLKCAMDISQRANQYLQDSKLNNSLFSDQRQRCDTVTAVALNIAYLLSSLMYPFMPSTAESISRQLNAPICCWAPHDAAATSQDSFKMRLLPGHLLGNAEYLFTRIDEKREEELRFKYGGGSQSGACSPQIKK
jgi:methionyl-tRNA synthetase